ncbi:ComEA family DNA-binding protein [Polaromonas sp. UC242_47]|uniref:ComEA family DNA-binding protein n=1 Tax=Polaromonas sp. UC242_47 TaxID=3374626 RepID=UPI003797AB89
MFKKLLVFIAAMYMAVSFAAVDVNKATAAELDGVKGIGPVISSKIVEERKKGDFKNWADLESRISGIKDKKSAALSDAGLTVNGSTYKGAPAPAAAAKTEAKPAAPAAAAKTDAKPAAAVAAAPAAAAAAAKDEKKDPKAEAKAKADDAKAKKDADKQAKADAKKKKADDAKAKADAAKAAKTAKADTTKPAATTDASAAKK